MWWVAWSLVFLVTILPVISCWAAINREAVVQQFNLFREGVKHDTPISLGNGNFAFNVDITGTQTLNPFNTLSNWAWHDFPREDLERKQDTFDQGIRIPPGQLPFSSPNNSEQEDALNPHRFNLGRIGLLWDGIEIPMEAVSNAVQRLNLLSGLLTSKFSVWEIPIVVETVVDSLWDNVGIQIRTDAFINQSLSIFIDFPYPTPPASSSFLGTYKAGEKHNTTMDKWYTHAQIKHVLDSTTYYANIFLNTDKPNTNFTRPFPGSHRYVISIPAEATTLDFTTSFSLTKDAVTSSYENTKGATALWWKRFWAQGAFVSCKAKDPTNQYEKRRTAEFMRRALMSQYLLATNAAGLDPPGVAGLIDLAGSGRSDLKDILWTLGHWIKWNKWDRVNGALPAAYSRYIAAAKDLASMMGVEGAHWGDFAGPEGRIFGDGGDLWSQVHPLWLAEAKWNAAPNIKTLNEWSDIVAATLNFMISNLRKNESSGLFDLEVKSGDGSLSINPVAELTYWKFGLHVATSWYERLQKEPPSKLLELLDRIAEPTTRDGRYLFDPRRLLAQDPPNPLLLLSIIPETYLNRSAYFKTLETITSTFAALPTDNSTFIMNAWSRPPFGLTYPLLSLAAIKLNDSNAAVNWLLDPQFTIDDAGMATGLDRALPNPYLPSSGAFLLAIAEIASKNLWPDSWMCESEGFKHSKT